MFNKKFEKEIDDRERERKDYMDDFFKTRKVFKKDDLKVLDNTLPQTLSNGKQYYLRSNYRGKVVIPEEVSLKIKNYIGEKAYKHCSIVIEEFYIDDNEQLQVISLSLMFYVGYTKYGLFGDEGRGFALSRRDIKDVGGDSIFYLEDLEQR